MKTKTGNSNELLSERLEIPLQGAQRAQVSFKSEVGNLAINGLETSLELLASGTLEYFEKQGPPSRTLEAGDREVSLTLQGNPSRRAWFHFPWSVVNGAQEWRIHLNPKVAYDLLAHSGGGNIKLDLAGMTLTHLSAETGGGNLEVILPEVQADLEATFKTGAGNVTIELPAGLEARIQAGSGLGKVIVDPWFMKVAEKTYESAGYEGAANKVTLEATSGAGNVSILTR